MIFQIILSIHQQHIFWGIDEDDICQIKTKSKKNLYSVYNLLCDSLKTKCIWIIHKGKVIKEEK
jgi:hypothetical protein